MGLGPELVANGGFETDANWTFNPEWSFSGIVFKAVIQGPASDDVLSQEISIVSGKTYYVTLIALVQNNATAKVRAGTGSWTNITDGSNAHSIVAGSTGSLLEIQSMCPQLSDAVTIDNVSVKEILGGMAIPGPEFMDEMESW